MARYLFIPRPGPKSEHFKKGVEEGRVRPIQHDAATSRTLARMVEIEHRRARKERELREEAEAKAERIDRIESKIDRLLNRGKQSTRAIEPELLTREQVVALTGLSLSTIYRREREGRFPTRKVVPGTRRVAWRTDEVHAWKSKLKAGGT